MRNEWTEAVARGKMDEAEIDVLELRQEKGDARFFVLSLWSEVEIDVEIK